MRLILQTGLLCVALFNTAVGLADGIELKKPAVDSPHAEQKLKAAAVKDLEEIQGKWIRTIKADRGTFTVLKEHTGNQTLLTITDSKGRVIEEKESEFRLDNTGKVRIFTYFNNVFTAGRQAGILDNEPRSYIYRIKDDRFIEIRGILIEDESLPGVVTWKRVKE